MGKVLALAHTQCQPGRARAAICCLDKGTPDMGFIVQQEGMFWLHPELHDSLLFSLDALQDTLNKLKDTLPPPGETQPFEVDPNSFWCLRLAGVNTESKVILASSAL